MRDRRSRPHAVAGVLADMGEPFYGRPAFDTYPIGLY
jgi:hypothetical protein